MSDDALAAARGILQALEEHMAENGDLCSDHAAECNGRDHSKDANVLVAKALVEADAAFRGLSERAKIIREAQVADFRRAERAEAALAEREAEYGKVCDERIANLERASMAEAGLRGIPARLSRPSDPGRQGRPVRRGGQAMTDRKDLVVAALRADGATALPHYHALGISGCGQCALAKAIERWEVLLVDRDSIHLLPDHYRRDEPEKFQAIVDRILKGEP